MADDHVLGTQLLAVAVAVILIKNVVLWVYRL